MSLTVPNYNFTKKMFYTLYINLGKASWWVGICKWSITKSTNQGGWNCCFHVLPPSLSKCYSCYVTGHLNTLFFIILAIYGWESVAESGFHILPNSFFVLLSILICKYKRMFQTWVLRYSQCIFLVKSIRVPTCFSALILYIWFSVAQKISYTDSVCWRSLSID